jgi:hypothetical protein
MTVGRVCFWPNTEVQRRPVRDERRLGPYFSPSNIEGQMQASKSGADGPAHSRDRRNSCVSSGI